VLELAKSEFVCVGPRLDVSAAPAESKHHIGDTAAAPHLSRDLHKQRPLVAGSVDRSSNIEFRVNDAG
jgi:hypothetical protein